MNHTSVKELITTVLHAVCLQLCTHALHTIQPHKDEADSGVARGGRVMLPARHGRYNTGRTAKRIFWIKTFGYVYVTCSLVQALRLCTGRTAHRRSRGIVLPFLDHGTRRGWGVSVTPRPLFTPGEDLVPIVQEAGWAPGPVWTGAENLTLTGIRSPDRLAVASHYTDWATRPTLVMYAYQILQLSRHIKWKTINDPEFLVLIISIRLSDTFAFSKWTKLWATIPPLR
jgi:hypothetical protein